MAPQMKINPLKVPISRRGSALCLLYQNTVHISRESPLGEGIYLRAVDVDRTMPRELLKLSFPGNAQLKAENVEGFPGGLRINMEDGSEATVCLDQPDAHDHVRITSSGNRPIRLEAPVSLYVHAALIEKRRCSMTSFPANLRLGFEILRGTLKLDAPWGRHQCEHITIDIEPDEAGQADLAIDTYTTTWDRPECRSPATEVVTAAQNAFEQFASRLPELKRPASQNAARLATYICWSNTVRPKGNFRREAIVMSKNEMSNVWPWDNCFNTMALCESHPELAWDQIRVVTDHQDQWGALPDGINPRLVQWTFCKAPIYGYTYRFCLNKNPEYFAQPDRLKEAYRIISKLTEWWLNHRRLKDRPLVYLAHGNDGFDTSTMFMHGCPLEGPDVNAYLSDQTDALNGMASRLGLKEDARKWKRVSENLLSSLVEELWDADSRKFFSRRYDGRRVFSDSSQMLIPLLLGKRLPENIIAGLLERLRLFITPHGIATELPDSPYYEPDGHCRGSIWAPPTFFITRGCRDAGATHMAEEIEEKTLQLLEREGFNECFDALAGTAQRELAYSWTANLFLLLCKDATTRVDVYDPNLVVSSSQ